MTDPDDLRRDLQAAAAAQAPLGLGRVHTIATHRR